MFTRFERLDGPLTAGVPGRLWQAARDGAELTRIGAPVPGGAYLGPAAVMGPTALDDPWMRALFQHAARDPAAEVRGDGRTEDQWQRAAAARGPLGGPTLTEAAAYDGTAPWQDTDRGTPPLQPDSHM